jgi:hypothetical protein
VRGERGRIVGADLDNIRIALSRLRITLSYDAFRGEILMNGTPADDLAIDRVWVRIDDMFNFRPSRCVLQTVITTEAHETSVHPVRQYLETLKWATASAWIGGYAITAAHPTLHTSGQ